MSGPKISAIVTDVEGTATSIAFVKEKLFPFARAHLADYVEAHEHDPEVAALLAETRALAGTPDFDTRAHDPASRRTGSTPTRRRHR